MFINRLGIGPDGRPLPIANPKTIVPRMFKCLVVNQDGSTYHIYHHYPHKIITLPLDPLTLTEEEKEVCETANMKYTTVKPLFNDPLRKGQLLYKGHFLYL